uniref:Pentatricopeptide repeat-containing protein n=1 Tax=Tanacetum cinerariifolium TaxID=118510 RepID=A0A6L2L894_TANCI|nr:pentatricopeptide repeat-containing protein [Tanacetum cinerariifolium]
MAKAKENALSVKIQIISSENVQNYQDIKIKRHLLEDLRVIATKMKMRRQRTKSVLLLKLPMRIPFDGQAVFTNEWDLGALAYSQETEGPYNTELPTPEEIHQFIQFESVDSNRIVKSKNVTLSPNQVLTKELRHDLKRWNELIYENVFGLRGYRDHLPACLARILYCSLAEQQYNLVHFFVKRIKSARATLKAHLPYGDDDEDDGASSASTSSPTTYLNSLNPLDYQNYQMPSSFKQTDETLFERQTTLLNQTQQTHKEMCGWFKSFRKELKGVFSKKKKIPFDGQALFTNEWDLGALAYSQETKGPYHTELPTPEEIHQFLQFESVDSNRIIKSKNVTLSPNQVLTKELRHDLKRWNELIYENVFGLRGYRDHLPACLAHILYCSLAEQQYNLVHFFVKRIESARATLKAHLPYDKLVDPEVIVEKPVTPSFQPSSIITVDLHLTKEMMMRMMKDLDVGYP